MFEGTICWNRQGAHTHTHIYIHVNAHTQADTASLLLSCPHALRGRKGRGVGFQYNHLLEVWLRPPHLPLLSGTSLLLLQLFCPSTNLYSISFSAYPLTSPFMSSHFPPVFRCLFSPSNFLQTSGSSRKNSLSFVCGLYTKGKYAVCNQIWNGFSNVFVFITK